MSSHNRRAAGIRRAWGRGPIILKLECLERRELLAVKGELEAEAPQFIRFHQGIGGAGHAAGVAQGTQQPAYQGGLAGAEVPVQEDHAGLGREDLAKSGARRLGGVGIREAETHQTFTR